MKKMAVAVLAVGLATWLGACSSGPIRVVVAAGTTLVDSGLIDRLAADFEVAHPEIDLSVVGDASAAILLLARNGAADVTLTHSPDLEQEFIDEGLASVHDSVFSSRFIMVGPPDQVDALKGLSGAEAVAWIGETGAAFVSRADGSGTNRVELTLWQQAGIDPSGRPWYTETGQGMGPTLQVASERQAFTLAELGSFITAAPTLDLVDAELDPSGLMNPYVAMAVANSPVRTQAEVFVAWLASAEGRESLQRANRDLFGSVVVYGTGG